MSEAPSRRPTIGLALGGGVARGWAHIGVIRALNRAGIEPDIICGTSIGAVVGGCHLAGHLDTLEDWARSLSKRRLLSYLDVKMGSGGLLGGRKLAKLMNTYLSDVTIESLPKPFVAVSGELATGHEVWIEKGPLVEAMEASYALPGIFGPQRRDGRLLIDGALFNPVPVSVCRAKGAHLVIAVTLNADAFGKGSEREIAPDVTPPQPAPKPKRTLRMRAGKQAEMDPERVMMRQLFGREQSTPGMGTVLLGALNIVMDRLSRSRMAGDPPDILACPKVGHVSLLDFHKADDLIRLGEEAIEREIPAIKDAMAVLQ